MYNNLPLPIQQSMLIAKCKRKTGTQWNLNENQQTNCEQNIEKVFTLVRAKPLSIVT